MLDKVLVLIFLLDILCFSAPWRVLKGLSDWEALFRNDEVEGALDEESGDSNNFCILLLTTV